MLLHGYIINNWSIAVIVRRRASATSATLSAGAPLTSTNIPVSPALPSHNPLRCMSQTAETKSTMSEENGNGTADGSVQQVSELLDRLVMGSKDDPAELGYTVAVTGIIALEKVRRMFFLNAW